MPTNLESSAVATRLEKSQFLFQSQRRIMLKNVQTTIQLCSFHMLARWCSKSFKLGFRIMWTKTFQRFKLDLEKAEDTRDQIGNIHWIIEKAREFQKNIYFWFSDYTQVFDCVDHNKLWKILRDRTLPASWETCMQAKKQQLEPDVEQQTGSKLRKEYVRAVYCHPAYLSYMQSTSCEMPS